MKYLKAQNVLPKDMIAAIQEFIDGEFIYIPRKDGQQKAWGEKSGTRESLMERNNLIFREYVSGSSVDTLVGKYYLSEQSIRRIIRQLKDRKSNSIHNHL